MTILSALDAHYRRLREKGEVPPYRYSFEKIGWCLVIDPTGAVRSVVPLREGEGRRAQPRRLVVPMPPIRGFDIKPNFLWDKTAYALGVTAGEGKRLAEEHDAFKARHRELLAHTDDPGLQAFLAFLDRWTPDQFKPPLFPSEMKDGNVVFRVGDELAFLHERPAAHAIWESLPPDGVGSEALCLVRGERRPIARLHPPIKGVAGAQSSGARIVSFNRDAFTSYGQEQGANAPVCEEAAFAYTSVLNHFLSKESRNRVQIGDISTVFWADGANAEKAKLAEESFAAMLSIDDTIQSNKVQPILEAVAKGVPLTNFDPELAAGVRFYVLGLSPNASRLSVRLWFEDRFGWFADNVARHAADLRIEPQRKKQPSIQRLLLETAVLGRRENIPPLLGGELLRAVLTGGRYPASLLATLLMRLRADREVSELRVAMLKAVVARDRRLSAVPTTEEPPVSLDPDCLEAGYLLGRLFAIYERAQSAALGENVNATIKDKYYSAASTSPQFVFPVLARGAAPHLARLRKERPGMAKAIEKEIGAIMERLSPGRDPFPRSLPYAQQALFALGYYHQRNKHYAKKADSDSDEAGMPDEETNE